MKQPQRTDSLVLRRAFLDAHPASGPLRYVRPREMLVDALQRLRTVRRRDRRAGPDAGAD